MSGLTRQTDEEVAGVDVQERGNSLRVATNSPHLVSLGCGRLSTAVTIHPIKQGRVTIGSDPSSDICIQGTGVKESHCHIENSHGVVTLYPLHGDTTVDGTRHEQPVRLSQGCMIGIGRSNYLRFNHPAEANLMKSVLPNSRISMAPIHFLPSEGFQPNQPDKQQNLSQLNTNHNSYQNQNATNENGKDYRQSGRDQNDTRFSSESGSIDTQNSHNVFTDGHKNLEKELDRTYKELSKRKPPVVPRKTYREFDQISNSSNSDQEVVMQRANTPPKAGGIMSKVSKFEYYVRNSQKTTKNHTTVPQNAELWSPKVFSSNSLTVNTPAKDVLVNRDVPTNFAVNKNQQRVEGNNVTNDLKLQKKIILNENNAVEARNCSYTNVVVKNQVVKIDQMAKSYQGVLSKTQNVERSRSRSPEEADVRGVGYGRAGKMQVASASFNRNPVFSSSGAQVQGNGSGSSAAELQRQQAQLGRMEDESQKFLEHARLEEILNMFAEFDRTEQNISQGVPTTPTEKKPHNKIITNGSLPRATHNNLIQASDGSYRFDTAHNRSDYSPHRMQPPSPSSPSPHNIPRTAPNHITPNHPNPNHPNPNHKLSNYENIQVLSSPNGVPTNPSIQMSQNPPQTDARSIQYSSQHSSYENFNIENQNVITNYTRQFPITELSSPVMIRKIARNAQSSANYVGSFEKNGQLPNSYEYNSPTSEGMQYYRTNDGIIRPNNTMSPYENIALKNNAPFNSIPKSPSSHSPRTRIKTTYAHKNVVHPQHFVFPSSSAQNESQITSVTNEISDKTDRRNFNNDESERCQGIEKQLSLTEDIPMIDDTDDFSNELEMRIARLKPESKKAEVEADEDYNLLDPDNVFNQRRNFEEIRRDLIADIPELDAIHRDIDRDLSESRSRQSADTKNSLNDALKKISEEMKDVALVDDVFDDSVEVNTESPQCAGFVQGRSRSERLEQISKELEMEAGEDEGCFRDVSTELEELRCKRKKVLSEIHKVKCKMTDIRSQEDDILRELEMEKALLQGEYDSEIAILNLEQRKLVSLQDKVRLFEAEAAESRGQQEARQAAQKDKVDKAADNVKRIEKDFSKHDATLEELRNAQEVLETERKVFEDMEFQDLEEEADWLAYREELQNDISALTQKIDSQKSRILNLRFETSNNLNAAVEETKLLQSEYVKMLNRIEVLTADLQSVEDEIKNAVMEIGSDSIRDRRSFTLEERRSRIKSGDFSPPSSDEDLSNAELFENRKKNLKEKLVSIDQMSRSMIVDLGEKRSIDDLVDIEIDHDRSLQSTECSPNKVIASNESSPVRVERSVSSDRSKADSCTDTSPDCNKEKKQGFWERNFDSLSRLKGKDKKNKQKQDVMWQSMNENMFFNNENIESEFGSFEKCNSLRSSKRSKEGKHKTSEAKDSTKEEKSLKLSFPSFGKMIRKDSLKKNKEEKVKSNEEIVSNKENIDVNSEAQEVKMDESSEIDQKNVKHRYVKNSKSCITENKYLSKCTKTSQQPISISPEKNEEHLIRPASLEYDDNRHSFADSLEEEVRIIDPMTGNTIRLESNSDYNREMSDIAEESREIGKEMAKEKTELAKEMSEIAKERSDVVKEAIEMSKEKTELAKGMFRKSAGDEFRRYSGEFLNALADNTKVPSQDDIDRISKVTLDAPLLSKNGDMNSLGRKTLDSLREVEKNRKAMLEQNGCQVMNDEREKISELKKRVQNEAKLQWEENRLLQNSQQTQLDSQESQVQNSQSSQQQMTEIAASASETTALTAVEASQEDCKDENTSARDDSFTDMDNCPTDISYLDKQLRHSQTDSFNSTAFIEDGEERGEEGGGVGGGTPLRPISQLSDLSSENGGLMCGAVEAPRRQRKISNNLSPRTREDLQRPLTRYLPIDQDDLNLRAHIESAGHQVDLCPHIIIDSTSCRGYLHKLGAKFHGWSKRWFVFERSTKTLIYYSDKNEKKPRGGAYFQVIEEVYLDHLNVSKSPAPLTTFVIKTRQRRYYLMAPSGQAARIWIDVVFTGAQGYTEYLH